MLGFIKKLFLVVAFLSLSRGMLLAVGAGLIFDADNAEFQSAKRALEMGLPSLAQGISERLLKSEFLGDKNQVRLVLLDSLIAQGNFAQAKKELATLDLDSPSRLNLRRAIVVFGEKSRSQTLDFLREVDEEDLSMDERAWFFILSGMLEYEAGNFAEAKTLFKRADGASDSFAPLLQAQAMSYLCSLVGEVPTDETLKKMLPDLELNSSLYAGSHEGVEFTKLLAYAYFKQNRVQDALSKITDALNMGLITESDIDSLKLLYAWLEPSRDGKKRVLVSLLGSTKSPDVASCAIYLLREVCGENVEDFTSILLDALENGSRLIGDRILYELVYISSKQKDFAAVDSYAQRLLKDYPVSQFKAGLYSILAWAQFSKLPPNYKFAAKYMLEVASLDTISAKESDFARFLAADCYFLDGDYESACAIYMLLVNSSLDEKWRGGAFARAVESSLNLDKITQAVELADKTYKTHALNPDDIWRAEWLIYLSYSDSEEFGAAFDRVSKLLEEYKNGAFNHDLLAKLYLLQARISESDGRYSKTLELVVNLLQNLHIGTIKASGQASDEVASNAMLIKARTLASMGNFNGEGGAVEEFEALRKKFPASDAGQISYLLQARMYAQKNLFAEAQSLCMILADSFPNGLYADLALYEAANYSRRLGLEKDYKQAIRLLSALIDKYPQSQYIFYAKIAQGEFLRLMGDFATASVLYEDIVSDFSGHQDVRLALVGLGDSYLAMPKKLNDAAAIFERIYSMPDMPFDLRAEAAFKWGFAIAESGRAREASEIWWMCINSLMNLSDSKAISKMARSDFSPKQKYWYSRILLKLAETLENLSDKQSAFSAYEILVKYELPGFEGVKSKISNAN